MQVTLLAQNNYGTCTLTCRPIYIFYTLTAIKNHQGQTMNPGKIPKCVSFDVKGFTLSLTCHKWQSKKVLDQSLKFSLCV